MEHTLGTACTTVIPAKNEIIKHFSTPTNKGEVRCFHELASYYRKHVKDFSNLERPLISVFKKYVRFHWDEECQKALETLKLTLINPPVLRYADLTRPYHLYTDARMKAWKRYCQKDANIEEYIL